MVEQAEVMVFVFSGAYFRFNVNYLADALFKSFPIPTAELMLTMSSGHLSDGVVRRLDARSCVAMLRLPRMHVYHGGTGL